MPPRCFIGCVIVAAMTLLMFGVPTRAQLMIVGNDQKPKIDNGSTVMLPPGHDTLSVVDISKPTEPRIVATIPMDNTVAGPPTNLAITPNRDIALVANSLNAVEKDGKWQTEPDNRLFVVDLKASPPSVLTTLTLGKQPSGLAINATGTMALVANRAEGTISVLSINGKEVKVTDTVTVGAPGDQVSAVAITPDGRMALAVKAAVDKVAVLDINGGKATYDKKNDVTDNNYPYNIADTPDGNLTLNDNTKKSSS